MAMFLIFSLPRPEGVLEVWVGLVWFGFVCFWFGLAWLGWGLVGLICFLTLAFPGLVR